MRPRPRRRPSSNGFPIRPAARIALSTVRSTDTRVRLVRFICFDEFTREAYEDLLKSLDTLP